MIRNVLAIVLSVVVGASLVFAQANLKGYSYGALEAPTGEEWQSPEAYAHGKLQPRATFYSFSTLKDALDVLPDRSTFFKNLDGPWRFKWVGNPQERAQEFYQVAFQDKDWDLVTVPMNWNIYGIQKDGSQKYGTPIYLNQRVPFYHEVKVDDWRQGVMRTPPTDYTMYKHRNEVGAYRRTFTVPNEWNGHEVCINFDGVDSFFYLWINGKYVGFSKNSRNRATFDISSYLVKGENLVAVEVYRNSDGTFLESQDMFRLPGIFRSVFLTAKPTIQIKDLQVIPDLDSQYKDATLSIRAYLSNLSKKEAKRLKLRYSLYSLPLYQDDGALKAGESAYSSTCDLRQSASGVVQTHITVNNPKLWSAELPYRYILVAELLDAKGRVIETVSTYTGIRKVEVKDVTADQDEFGLAGRYFLINGKPVKLKGVNRHETHPATGHVLTRKMMFEEIQLMKRANINHVRNSHYPADPYFYYLCDKYGIYLEDEANIESHQYYYGKESLSHVKEFDIPTTNRMLEMVYANINHPSIVIWSLGNEAGPGDNFKNSYAATKAVDTSRPVQYERNNDIVDIGSNQYPSIPWVREAVKGKYKIKYPFHISEYAHSMGNAVGGLQDYWTAIESTNYICGGAIWDWVDQAMYNYLPDGRRYFAYGGDFEDIPNDGMFVMNGIIFADRTPKPQYYEVKKVYQYVGITAENVEEGRIRIFNKNYYSSIGAEDYTLKISLYEDGLQMGTSNVTLPTIAPRSAQTITVDISEIAGEGFALHQEKEYFLKVQLMLAHDMPWAEKGFVQAEEQLLLRAPKLQARLLDVALKGGALSFSPRQTKSTDTVVTIKGDKFELSFDQRQGTIHALSYNGKTIIEEGNGPKLDPFRAACDNDNWAYPAWGANGLHNLKHKVLSHQAYQRKDGSIAMFYLVESQAPNSAIIRPKKRWPSEASGKYEIIEETDKPFGSSDFKFTVAQTWFVYPNGSIELQANIVSNKPKLPLGRLGYEVVIPKKYQQYSYYGRGPINNYSDRKTSQFIEQYHSTVAGQFIHFPKPQTMGNREEVRWVTLLDEVGDGLLVQAGSTMSISALPWSARQLLLAPHPHELPPMGDTHLHLDASVNGLGGNSCGQGGPLNDCRSFASPQIFSFFIRPFSVKAFQNRKSLEIQRFALSGEVAPIVSRSNKGDVTINGATGDILVYQIGKAKPQVYTGMFNVRDSFEITTWSQRNPKVKVKQSFPKINTIPLEVIYTSSQEIGSGDAKNMIDGSLETIWHTMYSVTVAQYPHWIDFDAGDERSVRGFSYLPRQDESTNGDIKDYKISISLDGKAWEDIFTGTFDKGKSLKKVYFPSAVKARYIRFTALSAQNRADYASGSEFTLISE